MLLTPIIEWRALHKLLIWLCTHSNSWAKVETHSFSWVWGHLKKENLRKSGSHTNPEDVQDVSSILLYAFLTFCNLIKKDPDTTELTGTHLADFFVSLNRALSLMSTTKPLGLGGALSAGVFTHVRCSFWRHLPPWIN